MPDTRMCEKREILVRAEDVVKAGNYYYFVALELNIICKIDLNDRNIEIIGSIPEESLYQERVCSKIYALEEQLIFLPMNGKKIWVYKTDKKKWRNIELEVNAFTDMKMMQAIKYENRIYFIGCFYPAIVVWNTDTDRVTYIREIHNKMKDLQGQEKINYFRCDYVLKENILYLASCLTNVVFKLNLTNHQWEFVRVGGTENQYAGIARGKKYFWLAPKQKNHLVRWDGYNSFQEYTIENEQWEGFFRFTGVVTKDNSVIFPAKDGQITYEIRNDDFSTLTSNNRKYLFYKVTEDREIISGTSDGVIQIEFTSRKIFQIKCEVSLTEARKKLDINGVELREYFEKKEHITEENLIVSLNELCIYLLSNTYRNEQMMVEPSITAKSIWLAVKGCSDR